MSMAAIASTTAAPVFPRRAISGMADNRRVESGGIAMDIWQAQALAANKVIPPDAAFSLIAGAVMAEAEERFDHSAEWDEYNRLRDHARRLYGIPEDDDTDGEWDGSLRLEAILPPEVQAYRDYFQKHQDRFIVDGFSRYGMTGMATLYETYRVEFERRRDAGWQFFFGPMDAPAGEGDEDDDD